MLTDYLQAALHQARYERLDGDEGYYGEIPACPGVLANAPTLEGCRDQLIEVLEEWVVIRLAKGLQLPTIDGHELRIRDVA
ncbi:type II toxin-antitoxin system HicB family antitoxin [Thiococcus pfennigii]|jgi:predicted RNase H-like HicB family nuclease|uniref:type II toxin-antitoxin system HicB family antitoxin n=1 Tax=Thiococcus pfennigii TaxID=1057 RepID=UPI0019080185|nr:type II toxin-antitoxin system HicB family antitoxin [Thiococcus pfennigii]MBK1700903.1 HicB family protein [Thiococcus pfennigii]MBK1733314.1 HicB family protein [Thiococcus pfennigii]